MGLPKGTPRTELWEARRQLGFATTMAENRMKKAKARYAEDMEKVAELQARVDELEAGTKPEGPWLPAHLPEAESFNRKWAEFLATMPEREAAIAKQAVENSARLREELARQDAEAEAAKSGGTVFLPEGFTIVVSEK